MSNTLRDKFELRPGQFWCLWGRGKQKVTLDRCFGCAQRDNCSDFRIEVARLDDDPDVEGATESEEDAQDGQEVGPAEDDTKTVNTNTHDEAAVPEASVESIDNTDNPDRDDGDSTGKGAVAGAVSGDNGVVGTGTSRSGRTSMGKRTVALSAISIDDTLYPRKEMDEENIERLRGVGPKFHTPIVVSENLVLVDGRHRVEALKLDGLTEVEVEVFKYLSDAALLEHAVELNCEHGLQLSPAEKKTWLKQVWLPGVNMSWLARVLGISVRSLERWTKNIRDAQKKEELEHIRDLRRTGNSIAETAAATGKSVATVKRVAQKRQLAQLSQAQERGDGGIPTDASPAEATGPGEEVTPVTPEKEPDEACLDPGDKAGGDENCTCPQQWSISNGKQEMQASLEMIRGVREKYRALPGPKSIAVMRFSREYRQIRDELEKWGPGPLLAARKRNRRPNTSNKGGSEHQQGSTRA